jgi:hypothetical protein
MAPKVVAPAMVEPMEEPMVVKPTVVEPTVAEPAVAEPYLVGYERRRRAHIADLIRQHAEDDAIHDQSGWTKWL